MSMKRSVDVVGDTAATVIQIAVGGHSRVVAGKVRNLESLRLREVGVFELVAPLASLALEISREP